MRSRPQPPGRGRERATLRWLTQPHLILTRGLRRALFCRTKHPGGRLRGESSIRSWFRRPEVSSPCVAGPPPSEGPSGGACLSLEPLSVLGLWLLCDCQAALCVPSTEVLSLIRCHPALALVTCELRAAKSSFPQQFLCSPGRRVCGANSFKGVPKH